jgi:hypothetical protein
VISSHKSTLDAREARQWAFSKFISVVCIQNSLWDLFTFRVHSPWFDERVVLGFLSQGTSANI